MNYPTLAIAIEGFLHNQAACGRSPNTIRNYKTELLRFSKFTNEMTIDSVQPAQIEQYFIYLKNDFRISHVGTTPIEPRAVSPKTISNAHGTLAVFWKWVTNEYQINNPFRIPSIKFYTKPIVPLCEEEINELLKCCKTTTKIPKVLKAYTSSRNTYRRDRAIILVLLDTGVRVSELCNMDINDLDMERGRVFVTGKGNKSRYVYMGKVSRQAVWSYISEKYPDCKPYPEDAIFTDRNNHNRLTRQGILLLLKRFGKRANIKNVHPHRFRHTFAIEFLRNGGNVFELQQLLGHSDLETAKKYIHLAQSDLETVTRKASPVDRWNMKQ
jgi:integrase/recombinase XerD